MPMNDMIKEKRKELGLTQEQVANFLGVTTPAVSKWENGVSFPDITILPALARLLNTDLNTLLCFHEELSEVEVRMIVTKIGEIAGSGNFKEAYQFAMDKIREYPKSAELIHSSALVLQGLLMMTDCSEEERENYQDDISKLYERVIECGDSKYLNKAKYMLASKMIQEDMLDKAEELLNSMPKYEDLDKRNLEANLCIKKENYEEAGRILERKLLANLSDNLLLMSVLVKVSLEENDEETANFYIKCAKEEGELFKLWAYNKYVVQLEYYTVKQDADGCLDVLENMMKEVVKPWNMKESPLTKHLPERNNDKNFNAGQKMMPSIISNLQKNERYGFLAGNERLEKLIQKCLESK